MNTLMYWHGKLINYIYSEKWFKLGDRLQYHSSNLAFTFFGLTYIILFKYDNPFLNQSMSFASFKYIKFFGDNSPNITIHTAFLISLIILFLMSGTYKKQFKSEDDNDG